MKSHPANKLPGNEWYKYAWVIGSYVQQDLKETEGIKISSPKEIQQEENLTIQEAMEKYNQVFCPDIDEKSRKIYVTYQDMKYEISKQVQDIIEDCWFGGEWASYGNRIGGDIRSIDMEKAYKLVIPLIVQPVINGEIDPVTEEPRF